MKKIIKNTHNTSEILNLKSINQFWQIMIATVKKYLDYFSWHFRLCHANPSFENLSHHARVIYNANCQNINRKWETNIFSQLERVGLIILIEGQDIHSFKLGLGSLSADIIIKSKTRFSIICYWRTSDRCRYQVLKYQLFNKRVTYHSVN